MKHVYIAGPLTGGNVMDNVRNALAAGEKVLKAGFAPFVPHLSFYWEINMSPPVGYEAMMTLDFAWLSKCDALIRLPGHSPGADREVIFAINRKIPVFYSVEEFLNEKTKQ